MNPLLDISALPRFGDIRAAHAPPAMTELIARHREKLAGLLVDGEIDDFDTLVPPLEEMSHQLSRIWSPVGHLHSVLGDTEWRDAYNSCLTKITEHHTEVSQNDELHRAFQRVASRMPDDTPIERKRLVEHALRDFRLAGVALPAEKKQRYKEARKALAGAQAQFEQNVQDSTDAWQLIVKDETRLGGLPSQLIKRAENEAREQGLDGWLLALDYPTYHAVMMSADDRGLRETFYKAWCTRASDQADDPQWDNARRPSRKSSLCVTRSLSWSASATMRSTHSRPRWRRRPTRS